MSKFGERLRIVLEEKNIQGKELAKILNVEPPTVSNWLNGNRFPKDDMLIQIADYFSVSVDFLLGRTDIRNIDNENNTSVTQEEAETLAEEFLDMLIKHKKIKTKEDLTPQNILKLLNEIFDEIDKQK